MVDCETDMMNNIYIFFISQLTTISHHLTYHLIISTIISLTISSSQNRKIFGSDLLIFISSYSSLFSNYDQFPTPKVMMVDCEMRWLMILSLSLTSYHVIICLTTYHLIICLTIYHVIICLSIKHLIINHVSHI